MSASSLISDPPVSPVNPDEEGASAIVDNPESELGSPVVEGGALESTSHDDATPIPEPDQQNETESRRSTRGWNVTIMCCVSSGHAKENDKPPMEGGKQSKEDKAKEKKKRKEEAKNKKRLAREREREAKQKLKEQKELNKKNNFKKEKPKKGKKENGRRSEGEKTAGDRKTSQSKPGATSKRSSSCLSAKPYDEKPNDTRTTSSKSRNTVPKQGSSQNQNQGRRPV